MSEEGLKFSISWAKSNGQLSRVTSAALTVSVDGETIWPVEQSL